MVKTFTPQNTANTLYISGGYGNSMIDIMNAILTHFGPVNLADIEMTAEHIHTNAIGYDLYDASDYTDYLVITRRASEGDSEAESEMSAAEMILRLYIDMDVEENIADGALAALSGGEGVSKNDIVAAVCADAGVEVVELSHNADYKIKGDTSVARKQIDGDHARLDFDDESHDKNLKFQPVKANPAVRFDALNDFFKDRAYTIAAVDPKSNQKD